MFQRAFSHEFHAYLRKCGLGILSLIEDSLFQKVSAARESHNLD